MAGPPAPSTGPRIRRRRIGILVLVNALATAAAIATPVDEVLFSDLGSSPLASELTVLTLGLAVSGLVFALLEAADARKSDEKLRVLVQGTRDTAIFMLDPEGKILTWNEGARRIKGYDEAEIVGQHFSRFYRPEDVAAGKPQRELQVARETGVYQEEGIRVRKDGSTFWASMRITPLLGAGNRLQGFSKVTQDITERKLVEAALQDSEAKFSAFFQNAQNPFAITDLATGQYLDVNTAFATTLGWPRDDILGKTGIQLGIMPDAKTRSGYLASIDAATRRGVTEMHLHARDGQELDFLATLARITIGSRECVASSLVDVTERKKAEKALQESEARFASLFHDSLMPLVMTRLSDGVFLEVNDAWTRAMGWTREEAVGKSGAQIGLFAGQGARSQAVAGVAETGKVAGRELVVQTKDGRSVDILVSMTRIRVGGQDCIASGFVDITARKKAEAELAQLSEFKSQFMGMVAHDLNNILTPMKLNLKLANMEQEKAGHPATRLKHVDASVKRMEEFLADLLDVVRLQAGRLTLKPAPFDLAARGRELVESQSAQALEQGVRLSFDAPPTSMVTGDAHRLDQVMANLLSNALKFTPAGGEVKIRLAQQDRQLCEVRDTGAGISEADVAKLFQPFSQVGGAKQGKHTGTGLGLFICKGIVEGHGGRIWCESKEGQGTSFTFTLPKEGPGTPASSSGKATA